MPDGEFLHYNEDNIMKHLLAIEDHLRHVKGTMSPEHTSCIIKHSLQLEEQADEAISHSTSAAPMKTPVFMAIRNHIKNLRRLWGTEGISLQKDMVRIRNLRKLAENLNPSYQISQCHLCSFKQEEPVERVGPDIFSREEVEVVKEQEKDLNISTAASLSDIHTDIKVDQNNPRGVIMDAKTYGVYLVAQVGGEVGGYIAKQVSGSTSGISNAELIDVLVFGVVPSVAALYRQTPENLKVPLAIVGTQRLARWGFSKAVGMVPGMPGASAGAIVVRAVPSYGIAGGNGLVQID